MSNYWHTVIMRSNIEGVAFDLDGTLYPNYRLNIRLLPFISKELRLLTAFGEARDLIRSRQNGGCLPEGDFYEYQAGITADILNKKNHEELQKEKIIYTKDKIEKLIYRGWEPLFKKIKLYKYVIETLGALRKAGYKTGLLSDFPPETKMDYLGISGGWDAVLCSEKCGALKPHPLPFTELARAMSLPPEKILYVGNSRSYDVKGAAGAGMKTAWIKNALFPGSGLKKPKPDFSFHSYRQLYRFMID